MAAKDRRAMRIAVLAGGVSDEREISLASGGHAQEALREAGYGRVDLLDPASPDAFTQLADGSYDVAFIALHGRGGEDGTIQGALEVLGIPYTGSDTVASACAVDKDVAKLLFERDGIPVPRGVVLRAGDTVDPAAIVATVGSECFVKPAVNGSSYGVRLVTDPAQLEEAIAYAFTYGDKVLVEERIRGTEVSVGVIGGDDDLDVLPIVEIRMPEAAAFYNLDVKYVDPTDIHRIPARLDAPDYELVQRYAAAAHRALGCFGFSRSDFIVSDAGPVILETNTIPGMTATSLFPDEVRHAGGTFPEACARLVDLALARGVK